MRVIFDMLLQAKKVFLLSFAAIFAVLLMLLATRPDKYEAHMGFLVRNQLAENLVTADPTQNALQHEDVTEETINSEVELLGSTDLLKAVVLDNELENEFLDGLANNRALAIEKATRKLSKRLSIVGVRKSSIIQVTYTSTDRDQAKRVLDSLSKQYLTQYTKLHNADGAAAFYTARSQALEASLQQAESQRAKLLVRSGYMLLPEGQHLAVTEVMDLQKARNDTETSLAETESRLKRVVAQQAANSDRLLTVKKVSANQLSVEELDTKLVDLLNRRTELRTKFVDGDPLVLQIERQIADTKAAVADAQGMHSEDVTTDVNPVRQALDTEANQLSQAKAGLMSRLVEVDRHLGEDRVQLSSMEEGRVDISDLDRHIKVLQDSVDLYRGKALAASAAEGMDPEKFSNIVVATHPTVPVLPAASGFNIVTSFMMALLLSLAIGLATGWRNGGIAPSQKSILSMFEPAPSS